VLEDGLHPDAAVKRVKALLRPFPSLRSRASRKRGPASRKHVKPALRARQLSGVEDVAASSGIQDVAVSSGVEDGRLKLRRPTSRASAPVPSRMGGGSPKETESSLGRGSEGTGQ
jgi:hypothetical protein